MLGKGNRIAALTFLLDGRMISVSAVTWHNSAIDALAVLMLDERTKDEGCSC